MENQGRYISGKWNATGWLKYLQLCTLEMFRSAYGIKYWRYWKPIPPILSGSFWDTFYIFQKQALYLGLSSSRNIKLCYLLCGEHFFLNKGHKHFLTFNVRHIFPPRVSFSSFITKCLAKIVQIHNVSGTGSDFTLPDFRSSWDALDAVLSPHSLRCVAYSPQLLISILSPPVSTYSNKPIQDHNNSFTTSIHGSTQDK